MADENKQQDVPENQENVPQPSNESKIEQSLDKKTEPSSEQIQEKEVAISSDISSEQNNETQNAKSDNKKILKIIALAIVAVIVLGAVVYIISEANDDGWLSNQMIAFYIAAGLVIAGIISWLILRKTFRTRLKMEKLMKDDPDIDDYLVIFDWSSKALYFPTIIASFLAAIILKIPGVNETVIGGIWFSIFFINFLVEEYDVSIKVLLIVVISIGFFLLWLHLLGSVRTFLGFFKKIAISMNVQVYLLVGVLGLFTMFISWFKGLFYYITLTPNYMNIQDGPTESGEQIGREDYNTRIDTSDFLERLMGFGRIIVSFKDRDNEPISLLVWRIKSKAEKLERVRGKFAIDYVNRKNSSI